MKYENLVPIIGTILNMEDSDYFKQMVTLRVENGVVNFMVSSETLVVECRQLEPGMRVAAFYDSSLAVPMIFPLQYQAQMITVLERNEQIALDYFNGALLAQDNSLQLNIAEETRIETLNGQRFSCCIGGRTLLVYYTATTRSIPPQTTPGKIVVMC
ncbi:MAG: hypothetical protein HFH15_00390 [Ruminococcus sp.]|jgi:hypothetical protein|nr:hypothetical protein [Ruminococcus sp.]